MAVYKDMKNHLSEWKIVSFSGNSKLCDVCASVIANSENFPIWLLEFQIRLWAWEKNIKLIKISNRIGNLNFSLCGDLLKTFGPVKGRDYSIWNGMCTSDFVNFLCAEDGTQILTGENEKATHFF